MSADATPRERYRVRRYAESLRPVLRADSVRVDKLAHVVVKRRFKLGEEDLLVTWPGHVVRTLGPAGEAYACKETRDPKGYRVLEVKVRPEIR